MRTTLTTSIAKLSSLFQLLEEHGTSQPTLLGKAGIHPSILSSPDNRLSLDKVHRLTQEAVKVTGDQYLGLHQGERFAGFSSILGYVMMNCENVRQAVEKLSKYQRICDEGTAIELDLRHDTARLQVSILDTGLDKDRQMTDYRLSGTYTYLQKLAGAPIELIDVRLRHPLPSQTDEYERIFKCPVMFDSSINAMSFARRYLELPVPEHNKDLLEKFEQYAGEVIDAITMNESYSGKVRRTVASLLQGEVPSIEVVARKLAMSVRNLQLKLQEENTTYSKILNEIRRDLAMTHLRDQDTSVVEIAYLLGYSEVSVFHRAFKKWTDTTPISYRRSSFS